MSIINDVLCILEAKGKKQSDLCTYLNINTSTMANWKTRNTDPPAKLIAPICEFLDISPYLLLTGKEKSPSIPIDELELITYYKELPEKEQMKLIGRAAALAEVYEEKAKQEAERATIKMQSNNVSTDNEPECIPLHIFDDPASAVCGVELGEGHYEELSVIPNTFTTKSDIVIRVKGNSMQPYFNDGDLILVRLTPSVEVGEIGIFRIGGSKGYIKQRGSDKLISLNPDYDDIPYTGTDEIDTIGRVIGVLKSDWIAK